MLRILSFRVLTPCRVADVLPFMVKQSRRRFTPQNSVAVRTLNLPCILLSKNIVLRSHVCCMMGAGYCDTCVIEGDTERGERNIC
jgi:hypothetical protein